MEWLKDLYDPIPLEGRSSKRLRVLKYIDKNNNDVQFQHELLAAQNIYVGVAFFYLFLFLKAQNRHINIIEIGTSTGGLTSLLDSFAKKFSLDYKLYSFDIANKVDENTKQIFYELGINLEIVDVFSPPGLIKLVDITKTDAMTVIFCDGGDKVKEIAAFSDMLRTGDIILGHDYGYDSESFKDKEWEAHELNFQSIKNTYQEHNLRFVYKKEMENAVWFCARKTTKVGKNLQVLTVCNEPYCDIMTHLITSLAVYHPELPVKMLALNLSEESKTLFSNLHTNVTFIDDSYSDFKNFEEERAYCESCRTWNMKQLMMDTGSNVFYLDGDVHIKDNLFELFEFFNTVDFCARIKIENPLRFNAGMIYAKNTRVNIKIVQQWEEQTRKHGWVWLSAQNELGNVLEQYIEHITIKTFPKKFDGIDTNAETVIVHQKGPKSLKETRVEKV